ncbi:hypothetical protein Cni_G09578 [Canna indica]|uniref:C2H2-type domain-containing protein n=1 Tax=Canna indica TaxID=4628 RepID=A0AAQ3K2L6_9LILI|nr:hypothetical protein Cni_G09578 [Canna indica]
MFSAAPSLTSRIIRRYRMRRRCRSAAVPRSGSWRRPPEALLERSRSGSLKPISHFLRLIDSEAEVVALSPETLLAASSFVCEVCDKEFRRDQNRQIHRRGHNLPWSFSAKKAPSDAAEVARARRRVYVCPEP